MTAGIRTALKSLMGLIGTMVAMPFVFVANRDRYLEAHDELFVLGGQALAVVPGLIGNAARSAYYKRTLALFEEGASIHFGSYFSKRGARIHAQVGIGAYCVIGLVDIGPRTRIASRVSITSGLHYHGSAMAGIGAVDCVERVSIGADSWIGEGAVIGADVGASCIVGMGSVVISPIPDRSAVIGNPARRIPSAANA